MTNELEQRLARLERRKAKMKRAIERALPNPEPNKVKI